METITNRQIMNFLESNSILAMRQFGFRRGLGTSDLLTKLHGEWSRAAGSGGSAHVLAIDIAGAFDKVSHTGLRYKASMYGLKGTLLGWLAKYLDGRRLHVVVGGQQSSEFPIQSGVPQGSILGPTLFLVYVNDSEDALQEGTDIGTYADDTTLYQCIPMGADIVQSSSRLHATVDSISQWGADWKITFEPTKSQALTIDHHRPPHILPALSFNGIAVPEEREIKLLGVLFDNQLSFSRYLRAMSSRALQRLHFLVKASRFLDSRGRATVYKGFVRPTLEYCSLVLMGAPCHILNRVQKRALKIIGPGLWLPSLHHRRMVAAQTVLFKLWYLPVDHPLKSLLPPSAVVRPADLRPTRQSVGRTHTHQLHSGLQIGARQSLLRAFPACAVPVWN